jgi:hypothetical protein
VQAVSEQERLGLRAWRQRACCAIRIPTPSGNNKKAGCTAGRETSWYAGICGFMRYISAPVSVHRLVLLQGGVRINACADILLFVSSSASPGASYVCKHAQHCWNQLPTHTVRHIEDPFTGPAANDSASPCHSRQWHVVDVGTRLATVRELIHRCAIRPVCSTVEVRHTIPDLQRKAP